MFNNSRFNQEHYRALIAGLEKLPIDYTYEYPEFPYGEKIGGSTESLLKRNLINSRTIDEFKRSSLGLIPTVNLFNLATTLTNSRGSIRNWCISPARRRLRINCVRLKQSWPRRGVLYKSRLGCFEHLGNVYSYLSATTGSIRVARRAGR